MLKYAGSAHKALVIGDGDGRFVSELALQNQKVEIDAVDLSRKMVDLTRKRIRDILPPEPERINLVQADIRKLIPSRAPYDLIATHFFFDVFSNSQLSSVIDGISSWAAPDALWIVSEFDMPESAWGRIKARLWLKTMYAFFRFTTKLENQRLPCWRPLLRQAGFTRKLQATFENGFIVSELWQRGHHDAEP
jgi:ubiquinone/menaquinone biosynthesis C-methylase UbiE